MGMQERSKTAKVIPEIQELADEVGAFMEFWGFKKVHGQIWVHLALSDYPLHATDLRQRLGVSKALISMTLADLLEYRVVYEAGKGERGRIVYLPNENILEAILTVVRRREFRLIHRIQSTYRLVSRLSREEKTASGLNLERVKFLGEFIQSGMQAMEQFLKMASFSLDKSLEIPAFLPSEKKT